MHSKIAKVTTYLIQAILGWMLFVPLSFLIPKKKNLIIFIGRDDGKFVDSIKYLFLYFSKNTDNIEFYFLTKNETLKNTLIENRLPSLLFPSIKSIFKLLRANIIVTDNWMWILDMKYHMLFNSKKVQIWHGIPLKKIELNDPFQLEQLKNPFYRIKNFLGGKYPFYDLLISTSEYFTENSFKKSFKSKAILESGYPRNDQFFKDINIKDNDLLINTDKSVFNFINKLDREKNKLILYAPTFRDTGGDAVSDNILELDKLNLFAEKNGIYFIFKFHPDPQFKYNLENYGNILFYNNSADVYPLLKFTDALITDYSSIYFDYLLLDKPIIYFPYDIDKYTNKDRELDFDYNKFTPGTKCYSQNELEQAILTAINNNNINLIEQRQKVKKYAFKFHDGKSAERIERYLNSTYIS